MKKTLKNVLTFLLCLYTISSFAQNDEIGVSSNPEIFDIVQQMPEFPGGDSARSKFLIKNLIYPDSALKNNIQGKVYISFIVEKDGSLTDIKLNEGAKKKGFGLEEEALRVVKLMPNWKPGKQNGQTVRVRLNLPVLFNLDKTDKRKEIDDIQPPPPPIFEKENAVFQIVEQMPEFPGGQASLVKYLQDHIHYPDSARKSGQQEKIYIGFVVETDGSLSKIEAAKKFQYPLLLEEAVRVVKSMPKWKPGKQNGKAVRTRFILPVTFKLK